MRPGMYRPRYIKKMVRMFCLLYFLICKLVCCIQWNTCCNLGIALNAIKSDKFLIYGTDQSGHVVGDDYDKELTELERVTKSDGWILDCPGEDDRKGIPKQEMLKRGFEYFYYVGKTGGDIYRYRKQVIK